MDRASDNSDKELTLEEVVELLKQGKAKVQVLKHFEFGHFSHRRWKKICKNAGLSDLKFHDLRKTFGLMLAQNGISTAVTQRLLEHSSPNLTNKVYMNVDPVLRRAVEQLPVCDWL